MFKKHLTVLGPILLCILILIPPDRVLGQTPARSGAVLASVNGVAITSSDLSRETALLQAEMRRRNQPIDKSQFEALHAQLIENLIERELLRQHALQKKVAVRPQWIQESLAELQRKLGGAGALQNYLTATGQTRNELRDRLKAGLAVRRLLRREAVRSLSVSEAEKEAFYRNNSEFFQRGEQIRARHLLVAVNNWNDETQRLEARRKIDALKLRVDKKNFAVLALENSDCPSRARAGDLGYLKREQMIGPFAEAAFALSEGEISDVVSSRFGYHLILLLDRTPAVPINYKEAREKIERTIRRNKENAAVKRYVSLLKAQATIDRSGSH